MGSVTWFFSFFFFRRLTPRTWRRRTWSPCALLSLSLSLSCRGLARALRGDAGRVLRSGSSLHLFGFAPFHPVKGGRMRTTRFLLDFHDKKSQNRKIEIYFFADVEISTEFSVEISTSEEKKGEKKIPPWPIFGSANNAISTQSLLIFARVPPVSPACAESSVKKDIGNNPKNKRQARRRGRLPDGQRVERRAPPQYCTTTRACRLLFAVPTARNLANLEPSTNKSHHRSWLFLDCTSGRTVCVRSRAGGTPRWLRLR